jgi:hypothetical protein
VYSNAEQNNNPESDVFLTKISNASLLNVSVYEVNSSQVNIFPNPCYDKLNLKFDVPVSGKICLYDYEGKLIYCTSVNGSLFSINVQALKEGMYVFIINDAEKYFTGKFTVIY